MARRKDNLLKDIIEITAKMPWWVGVTLAIVSYLVLSIYSAQDIVSTAVVGKPDIGSIITSNVFKAIAQVGQYIFPLVFIIGSVTSAIQQRKRSRLLESASSTNGKSAIELMSWREFEMLVSEAFRKQGYKVRETPYGPDGGVDLVLSKDDKKILVQCKHWKTQKVGVKTVRELYGVLTASDADEVNIVCSGQFTNDAKAFVKDKPIYLVDGNVLADLIQDVMDVEHDSSSTQSVCCPVCGSDMTLRLAQKGSNVGKQFYGCTLYPQCKGIRAY